MATRQYVGARYVPFLAGEWNINNSYEALSIVTANGSSYTSKKPVPAGVQLSNVEYWVQTGTYNAQVEQYRQQVLAVNRFTNKSIVIVGASNEAGVYGITPWTTHFANLVAPYGATVTNLAIGGNALLAYGEHGSLRQQVENSAVAGDIYIITLPANDFVYQVVDITTYMAEFSTLIGAVLAKNPKAQIFVKPSVSTAWTINNNGAGFVYGFVKSRCDAMGVCFIPQESVLTGMHVGVNMGAWTVDNTHYSGDVTPIIATNIFNAVNSGVHAPLGNTVMATQDLGVIGQFFDTSNVRSGFMILDFCGATTINVQATLVFDNAVTVSGNVYALGDSTKLFAKLAPQGYGSFFNGKMTGDPTTYNVWCHPSTIRLNSANKTFAAGTALNMWGTFMVRPDGNIAAEV